MIDKINKWLPIPTLLIVLAFGVSLVGGNSQSGEGLVGGDRGTRFPHGITIGSTGTNLDIVKTGTVNCSGALAGGSVVGSSTLSVDCAISGVLSGDIVLVGSPAAMTGSYFYTGAYASTTLSGYIVAKLYNNSGATAIPPATATTSVPYVIMRPQ